MLICLRGPLFCHLNTKWKKKEIQRQFWREWFKSFLNQLGRKDLFFDHKTRRFRRVQAPLKPNPLGRTQRRGELAASPLRYR